MISQREARRLKKRVEELEARERARNNRWAGAWPGGVHLGGITRPDDWLNGRIDGARMLGHAVVVTVDSEVKKLNFYAVKLEPQ
jgi:hypothetical protein